MINNEYQRLARLCAASYHGDLPAGSVMFRDRGHIAGFWHPSIKTLIFTGSNDRLDWSRNLDKRMDNGIHAGFKLAWLTLQDEVLPTIRSFQGITVAGHSLGGAIAQIFALYQRGRVKRVVTFGAPRVFDFERAGEYRLANVPTARFVYWDDPVPWLPMFAWRLPSLETAPYHHTAPATYLPWSFAGIGTWARHGIERYVNGLGTSEKI